MNGDQIALSIAIALLALSAIVNSWQAVTYRYLRDAMNAALEREESLRRQQPHGNQCTRCTCKRCQPT